MKIINKNDFRTWKVVVTNISWVGVKFWNPNNSGLEKIGVWNKTSYGERNTCDNMVLKPLNLLR